METLESSRVCRLCGKYSGISIDIFNKNENHVKKINAVLPIMVHEMDLLPKHMCHRCSYKLEEFHKFYVECLRTDANLKSQLSWMQKEEGQAKIGTPMVHIQNLRIKVEPPDYEAYELEPMIEDVKYINSVNPVRFSVNGLQQENICEGTPYSAYTRCKYCCDKTDQSARTATANYERTITKLKTLSDQQENVVVDSSTESQNTKNELLGRCDKRQSSTPSWNDLPDEPLRLKPDPDESVAKNSPNRRKNLVNSSKNKFEQKKGSSLERTIVRNLRPRTKSIDYACKRKKAERCNLPKAKSPIPSYSLFNTSGIKIESIEGIEGMILRTRKVVNYIETKKRKPDKKDKRQRHEAKQEVSLNPDIENSTLASWILPCMSFEEGTSNLKQEPVDEALNFTVDGVMSVAGELPKSCIGISSGFVAPKPDPLPNSVLPITEDDFKNHSTSNSAQPPQLPLPNKFEPLPEIAAKRLQPRKSIMKQEKSQSITTKALRSQDVHLRNGKLKTPLNSESKGRRTRRNFNNIDVSSSNYKNFINNIKHYCEKCNVSFASKELYKLHACYV